MNMIAFAVDTASVEDVFIMGGGLSLEMIASAVSTARVEDVFNVRDGAWWAKAGGTATILEKGGITATCIHISAPLHGKRPAPKLQDVL